MRVLYVVECEVVSRNTAADSKFSAIMLPCNAADRAVIHTRHSIANKKWFPIILSAG